MELRNFEELRVYDTTSGAQFRAMLEFFGLTCILKYNMPVFCVGYCTRRLTAASTLLRDPTETRHAPHQISTCLHQSYLIYIHVSAARGAKESRLGVTHGRSSARVWRSVSSNYRTSLPFLFERRSSSSENTRLQTSIGTTSSTLQRWTGRSAQTRHNPKVRPEEVTPWIHGVVVVPKQQGGIRFCPDYRPLNKFLIGSKFDNPTPFQSVRYIPKEMKFLQWSMP